MSAGTALAARLDALARQVRAHADDLAAVRQIAESAYRVLHDLVDRVAAAEALAAQAAEQVMAAGADPAQPARSWSWLESPDPAALAELVTWIDRVLIGYPDTATALAECWVWHPWVVEELLALQQAWCEAYHADSPGRGVRAVDWHDRHRPGVAERIARLLRDCGLDAHRPGGRADHTHRPTMPGRDQLTSAGSWWTATAGQVAD